MALSKIKSDSIDTVAATKLTGTVDNARITLDAAEVPDLDAAKITTGDIALARLGNAPATDLTPVRQDIAMLAIREGVTENKVAYNLTNSFIDIFQDSTGITTTTDTVRNASEYVSTYGTTTGLSGLLDFGVANFTAGSSGDIDEWTWGSGASSNDLSAYNGANEKGGTTLGASTPIVFGAGEEFEVYWLATTSGTGYGPYVGVAPTTYTGNYNNSNTTDTMATTGAMVVVIGAVDALRYNASGSSADVVSADYTGKYCKILRDSSNYLKFYSGDSSADTLRYTSTATHSGAYQFTISQQGGGPHGSHPHDLQYKIESTVATTPATGTLISDQQTVPSAITKMSGVILYKENAGDSVLGTHLKIYFSATGTGASDWVEATYTEVTAEFSTGIKMARLGSTTVPSGTLPTMKAVWASQVASSLETQLHGWAMNYWEI